jgi:hypothetical protein
VVCGTRGPRNRATVASARGSLAALARDVSERLRVFLLTLAQVGTPRAEHHPFMLLYGPIRPQETSEGLRELSTRF